MLVPSIDLYDGQAVQWRQGRERVLARDDVHELLQRFALYGEVALIDLNAATGEGNNRALILDLLKATPCRVGGGIRDLETARMYLKAGASRIILGTAARADWVAKLPREAVIAAIDARGDEWLTHGWQEGSGEQVADLIGPLAERAGGFLYTQVEKEGMMAGLDRARIQAVVDASPVPVTVAGGVTTPDDVAWLHSLGASAQIGMAIYTGALDLGDAFLARVDFDKGDGLVPTVVQDDASGDVLMLAYSSPETLKRALAERKGIYWSRSRGEVWEKGATSGHTQHLVRADLDCDGDTVLFRVRQTGDACHLGRPSCFPTQRRAFSLARLDATLAERAASLPEGSWTTKLLGDESLRAAKLREETEELIEATKPDHVRWEAADLLYFALVEARAHGVGLKEITDELRARHA